MKAHTKFARGPKFQAALVLLLSIILGVGTYLYLISYQARIEGQNKLAPVLVAKGEIPSGTSFREIIESGLVEVRNLPEGSIPTNSLTPDSNPEQSLMTRGPLVSGQLLISSYFTSDIRANVGLTIPRGMLAVTVSIDDVARVGNFVLPGSRVVIFATATNNSGDPTTEILMPEALVIGIGEQTDINLEVKNPVASPLVTLALSPQDAKRLIMASAASRLTLALAHENDPYAVIKGQPPSSSSVANGG